MTRLRTDGRRRDAPWRRDSVSSGTSDLAEGLLKRRALLQLLNLVGDELDQLLEVSKLRRDCLKQLLNLLMLHVLKLLQLLQLLGHELQQLNCLLQGRWDVGVLCQRSLSTGERLTVWVELLRITEWRANSKCSSNHVNSFRVIESASDDCDEPGWKCRNLRTQRLAEKMVGNPVLSSTDAAVTCPLSRVDWREKGLQMFRTACFSSEWVDSARV